MFIIYDICQLSPINILLEDPHLHCGGKFLQFFYIIAYYFSNCRTPARKKKKIYLALEERDCLQKKPVIHRSLDQLLCSISHLANQVEK